MIDLKITEVGGGDEIARVFSAANSALRGHVQMELDNIGQEAVVAARSGVPRKTGRTMARIAYRHGDQVQVREGGRRFTAFRGNATGPLKLTVLPGEPTAHLIERGVNATVRVRRSKADDVYDYTTRLRRRRGAYVGVERNLGRRRRERVAMGVSFVKPYQLRITPRPYFIPAIQSLGDVGARLQGALRAAASASLDQWWNK